MNSRTTYEQRSHHAGNRREDDLLNIAAPNPEPSCKQASNTPLVRRHGRWSPEEEDYLRRAVKTQTTTAIAMTLGRSESAVLNKLRALDLTIARRPPGRAWTDTDDAFVIANGQTMTADDIARQLGFAAVTVLQRARKVGVRLRRPRDLFLSLADLEPIRENCTTMSANELAQRLGCSVSHVRRQAKILGVTLHRANVTHRRANTWSDEQLAFLREKHKEMPGGELAKRMGVSRWKLRAMAKSLQLELPRVDSWSQSELALFHAKHSEMTCAEFAAQIGRSHQRRDAQGQIAWPPVLRARRSVVSG